MRLNHRSRRFDVTNLRAVAGVSAAAVTLLQAATAVVALRSGRRDYADAVWGPGLAGVSLVSAVVGRGNPGRRWSLAVVSTGWAVRLERQMLSRVRGSDDEDPRYTEFLEGDSTPRVVAKVFLTQGLSQLLVSAPVQLAAASTLPRSPRRWLAPAGVAVMVAGTVVEALADRQKQQYTQRDDGQKPNVLDTGLWVVAAPKLLRGLPGVGRRVPRRCCFRPDGLGATGACADVLPAHVRHRSQAHRAADAGPTGLLRLPEARRLLPPTPAPRGRVGVVALGGP